MTRWRLEWLRLVRTGRWIPLFAVFLLLGLGEPLVTHYLGQLLTGATGDTYIHITVSTPRASDGMGSYFGNITTLGTLVTAVIAGLAFAIRSNPPLAALYLTHVPSRAALLLPRLAVVVAATTGAAVLGGAAAGYATAVLIGTPATGATIAGVLVSGLYMVFVVAVTFLAASLLRGQVAVIAVVLGAVFVAVPFIGLVPGLRHIGPNALGSLPVLLQTTAWTRDDTWAVLVTVLVSLGCVAGGLWRARRWQL